MLSKLRKLWAEEEGQGMTEYGLIIAIVAVAVAVALVTLRDKLIGLFEGIELDPGAE